MARKAKELTALEVSRLKEAGHHAVGGVCRRRSKFEPPCRLNIEPGVEADFYGVGCG